MKDRVRRIILFAVIVITGSVLILFDIPIIVMIPIVLAIGVILLFLLGAITVADIRMGISSLKFSNLRNIGIFKKLDGIKFFEKKVPSTKTHAAAKSDVKKPKKPLQKRTGIRQHIDAFVSSVKSLGRIIQERGKHTKKIEDIDKLLDKTVTEKVRGAALASAGTVVGGGVGGGQSAGNVSEQDPFLSLSGDELENGLLDSLDGLDLDNPSMGSAPGESGAIPTPGSSDLVMDGMDMPALPDDLLADADAILKENASGAGLEEFSSLEGAEAIDANFDELDDINIDDVDTGEDIPVESAVADPAPKTTGTGSGALPADATSSGKDAKDAMFSIAGNQVPDANEPVPAQEEISFAPSPTGDDDLLSSLASEIKQVKKESDLSLLRDLKDFKAPASDIEVELGEIFNQLTEIKKTAKPVASQQPMNKPKI